jgi:hypothetical protein
MTRAEEKLITAVRTVIARLRDLPPEQMTTTEIISVVETLESVLAECEPLPAQAGTDLARLGAPLT